MKKDFGNKHDRELEPFIRHLLHVRHGLESSRIRSHLCNLMLKEGK